MKKVDYLVTAKCEALYEYANSVMAKYEDYLDSESALDCIKIFMTICVIITLKFYSATVLNDMSYY